MKKILLSLLLSATAVTGLRANIEDDLPTASIGYMITDLRTDRTIADYNCDKLLVPASVMKLVTVAAALDRLGDDFRFSTKIYHDGYRYNDTIYGNLHIDCSGDPTLHLNLIDSLKARSIARICGAIVTNAGHPEINPTWMVEDIGSDYGVGWSHLNYKNNEILVNDEYRASELEAILADIAFDLSLNDIVVKQELLTCDTTKHAVATIMSPELSEICKELMHKSINLYAEAIGRALTPGGKANEALEMIGQYASGCGIGANSLRQKDFCGLARTNLITPRALNEILKRNASNRSFTATFPAAGREGTVKRLLSTSPLKGRIIAKSGSMDGILAYAGYCLDRTGKPTHTFAIMINNSIIPTSALRKEIEKWFMKYFL